MVLCIPAQSAQGTTLEYTPSQITLFLSCSFVEELLQEIRTKTLNTIDDAIFFILLFFTDYKSLFVGIIQKQCHLSGWIQNGNRQASQEGRKGESTKGRREDGNKQATSGQATSKKAKGRKSERGNKQQAGKPRK
jgi:hypothetical protein